MRDRKKRDTVLAFLALLFGGILAYPAFQSGSSWLTAPLVSLGKWLRETSLSGGTGDLLAWTVVIVCSGLPALGLLWKGRQRADWLLILLGGEIFAMLYFLVNPALAAPELSAMGEDVPGAAWAVVSFGCVSATAISWALLRMLDSIRDRSAELLPGLLGAVAIGYAFLLGWSAVTGVLQQMQAVSAGNTDLQRVTATGYLLILVRSLELVPEFLGAWLLILGGALVPRLVTAPFEEDTVVLAERIAASCRTVAAVSLVLTVAGNLVQLLLFSRVARIRMTMHLPLGTLVGCAVLMLLCRYFRRAKQVSDDNATII